MSKYSNLWKYVASKSKVELMMTFEEISSITGIPVDHSFLNLKKELLEYGYKVHKISIKEQTVCFRKIG